jgi:hypothetical protein
MRGLLDLKLIALLALSTWNYIRLLAIRKPISLFIGAGSGLVESDGAVCDTYLPEALSKEPGVPQGDLAYFLSATDVARLWSMRRYLYKHRVILYSFLVAPIRAALVLILFPCILCDFRLRKSAEVVCARLRCVDVDVSIWNLLGVHARFYSGYLIFRLLFASLKIVRSYVVSAYSNSEGCAALKRKAVRVLEIQHGIVGPAHRGYNYAVRNPRLPTPDEIEVYSEFWREELIVAGFFDSTRIRIGARVKYVLAARERSPEIARYYVFTGQGIFREEVLRFLREFGGSRTDAHLFYVPHPTESREYLSAIDKEIVLHPNVHRWPHARYSTECLIMHGLGHVSIYSSCHFDAAHFGRRSYVLDVMPENPMHYYTQRFPLMFVPISGATAMLKSEDALSGL